MHKKLILVFSVLFFTFLISISQVKAIHISCGSTLTSNTTLDSDLNCPNTGIFIGANDVVLDCQGFVINHSQTTAGSGINITGFNSATIKDCNIFQANSSVLSFMDGIHLSNSFNNKVLNNNISHVPFQNSLRGISLRSSHNNTFINNNLTISMFSNGILLSSSSHNNFIGTSMVGITNILSGGSNHNNISFGAFSNLQIIAGFNDSGVFTGSNNNYISHNRGTDARGPRNPAIRLFRSDGNIISNNNLSTAGAFAPGIRVDGNNNIIQGNVINMSRGMGIELGSVTAVNHNRVINNKISAIGIGILLDHFSQNNTLLGNDVETTGDHSTSIFFQRFSSNNTLKNNVLKGKNSYMEMSENLFNNTMENTTFLDEGGSIRFPEKIDILPGFALFSKRIISKSNLNISLNPTFPINTIFLNSNDENVSFLNRSAELTMFESFINPKPIVDINDNGTFVDCDNTTTPRCDIVSVTPDTFVFNVSSFTTYGWQETGSINKSNVNLHIFKWGTTAVPGRVLDYFIYVTNVGTETASDVEVFEAVNPILFTLLSTDPLALILDENTTSQIPFWIIPDIEPGASEIISYRASLNSSTPLGTPVIGGPGCASSSGGSAGNTLEWVGNVQQCKKDLGLCKPFCDAAKKACEEAKEKKLVPLLGPCIDLAFNKCQPCLQLIGCFPPPPDNYCDEHRQPATAPRDPNEKGVIANKFIQPNQTLVYTVHFENVGNISALDVFVTDKLDSNLNLSTLEIMAKNGTFMPLPENETIVLFEKNKTKTENVTIGNTTIEVNITIFENWTASLNDRTISWSLLGIDLPPNETDTLLYSIKPLEGLSSGTEIKNNATIQFEIFETITTNEVVNIIDDVAPECVMDPLPNVTTSQNFTISWTGTDVVGEIDFFNIFSSINEGNFTQLISTTGTNTTFNGELNTTYGFLCLAEDTAGNAEFQDPIAETSTVVIFSDTNESNIEDLINLTQSLNLSEDVEEELIEILQKASEKLNKSEEETKVKIKGDIELSIEVQEILDNLIANFTGAEKKINLKLKIEKNLGIVIIKKEKVKGNLTNEQQGLWEDLKIQTVSLLESAVEEDLKLNIKIKHKFKSNEDRLNKVIDEINDFIEEVNSFLEDNEITNEQANLLITTANNIITQLTT